MSKKFTISVLTYTNFPGVRACVESILRNSKHEDIQLVLTDNGNPTGAGKYFDEVAQKHPGVVRVVHNPVNEGFIPPNNRVFAECDTPYLVLVNDDLEIMHPGWLDEIEKPFLAHPKASLVGPVGGCQHLTENFEGRPFGNFEYLEGSLLAIKVDTRRPHPLFPPYVHFAYGEDSALSLEQRKMGYTLHQINLRFRHARAQTSAHMRDIKGIQAKNHAALRKRWGHYIRVRKFEYPIVVRRMAARGDVLLATPVIRQIAKENPLSPIYVETQFPEIFQGNPHVKHAAPQIQRAFDTRVIGLDMAYEQQREKHVIDCYAEAADVAVPEYKTELYVSEADTKWAKKRLDTVRWAAIHAGPTTWAGKNWPAERFSEVARYLKAEHKLKTVLVGHNDGTPIVCDLDLRGLTSTHQTAAILKECKLFVGLDSFPMHIAQAVGTPTIGLFGVTSPKYLMTEGSPHIGIQGDLEIKETGARHRITGQVSVPSNGESMRSIAVKRVTEAADQLLKPTPVEAKVEVTA